MNKSLEKKSICLNRDIDKFSEQLYQHYLTQHLTDITFYFPNAEPIQAHKIILSAHVPFFEEKCFKSADDNRIMFLDISVDAFKYMLELIYKGKVEIEENVIPAFNKLIKYFKIADVAVENTKLVLDNNEITDELENVPCSTKKKRTNNFGNDNEETSSRKLNPFTTNKKLKSSEVLEQSSLTYVSDNNDKKETQPVNDSFMVINNSTKIDLPDSTTQSTSSTPDKHTY